MVPTPAPRLSAEAAWMLLLLGVLAGRLVGLRAPLPWMPPGPRPVPPPLAAPVCSILPGPLPPRPFTPRELRGIPGVGERRACAIARAVWAHDPALGPLDLEAVPGVGPATAGRVRSRVAETGRTLRGHPVMTESSTEPVDPTPRPAPSPAGSELPAPRIGRPDRIDVEVIDQFLSAALDEDRGAGDVTSQTAVPAGRRARARLVAKQGGVLAGLDVFARTFELCDADVTIERLFDDGDAVEAGTEVARLEGRARALLLAERTALNMIQRMSGIATQTASFVALAEAACDPAPRLLDTRKTTPLLRVFEKYAVRCGGGENHRFGLYDEVMVKDNHVELAGRSIEQVLADLRASVGPGVRITAEARDAAEARAAVRGGADVVMLDNLSPGVMAELAPGLRALAAELGHVIELEASGGIDAETIGAVARSGVDRISIGALTHSPRALDLSLSLEPVR